MNRMIIIAWLSLLSLASAASPSDDSGEIKGYYDYWCGKYLKKSARLSGGMYVDYQGKGTTCSEAQGYGMLIIVRLSKKDDIQARQRFDALNKFQMAFRSNIDPRMMAWYIDDKVTTPVDTTCATDGDMDIAYALLLAADKWGEQKYQRQAKKIIAGIKQSLIREDFSLRRGDWDKTQHSVRLSDIMPAHFRAFGKVADKKFWERVTKTQYAILNKVVSASGVFPDFVVKASGKWKPAPANYLESKFDGMMYYNSCRVPWRLACAALIDQDMDAKKLLSVFNSGIGKVKNKKFMAGYKMNAEPLNQWTDGAFTAPHMCSLLVAKRTKDFKAAFIYQLGQKEEYFQDSIRLLALYLCSKYPVNYEE